jgi:hypothetical protein
VNGRKGDRKFDLVYIRKTRFAVFVQKSKSFEPLHMHEASLVRFHEVEERIVRSRHAVNRVLYERHCFWQGSMIAASSLFYFPGNLSFHCSVVSPSHLLP